MARNLNPERVDPRSLQTNFRAVESYLDGTITLEDGRTEGVALLGGRRGGQVLYLGTESGDDGELHSNPSADGLVNLGDTLYVDEANGYVGINTSAPGAEVHVQVADGGVIVCETTGTNSQAALAVANDARTYVLQVDGTDGDKLKVLDSTAGTAPIQVEAAAPSTSVYVDSSGRVGIGTSPSEQFHVIGPGARLRIDNTSAGGQSALLFAGTVGIGFGTVGSLQQFVCLSGASNNTLILGPNGELRLRALGTATLDIVDAGTAGATESGWVEIKIAGGSSIYLRGYATK